MFRVALCLVIAGVTSTPDTVPKNGILVVFAMEIEHVPLKSKTQKTDHPN